MPWAPWNCEVGLRGIGTLGWATVPRGFTQPCAPRLQQSGLGGLAAGPGGPGTPGTAGTRGCGHQGHATGKVTLCCWEGEGGAVLKNLERKKDAEKSVWKEKETQPGPRGMGGTHSELPLCVPALLQFLGAPCSWIRLSRMSWDAPGWRHSHLLVFWEPSLAALEPLGTWNMGYRVVQTHFYSRSWNQGIPEWFGH